MTKDLLLAETTVGYICNTISSQFRSIALILTSGITPAGNGAVSVIGSVVWWWHVVGETDWPDVFVELNILGGLENAYIVDDLSGRNFVALVTGDALQEVSFLVASLLDLVVSTDDNFIGSRGLIPTNKAMSSSQNKSRVNDGAIAKLTVTAETLVGQHNNVWIFTMYRGAT